MSSLKEAAIDCNFLLKCTNNGCNTVVSYDEDMVKQYIDGIPVINMSKKALRKFDYNKHVKPVEFDPDAEVWVSCDFNIDPMGAVLWNKYPEASAGPTLKAFDEITLQQKLNMEN